MYVILTSLKHPLTQNKLKEGAKILYVLNNLLQRMEVCDRKRETESKRKRMNERKKKRERELGAKILQAL